MKKGFTLVAALMLAFSAIAENVYFKTTAATSWWADDGAKIGAQFKVGTNPKDFGMYADFFTLVPGTTDTYVGTVPTHTDPFVAVQFLRYNPEAETPDEELYWNATGIETWDGVNDMFTATATGENWDSTTGTWSKYTHATGVEKVAADATAKVQKMMINGQMIIEHNDIRYNAQGATVK